MLTEKGRINAFCQELTTIANKYKLSLQCGKSGITIHNEPAEIIYAGVVPNGASGTDTLLITCFVAGRTNEHY